MKNGPEDGRPTGQGKKECLLRKAWTQRKRTQEVSSTYVHKLVAGLLRQHQDAVLRHDTDEGPCREQDNCLNRTQKTVPVRTLLRFYLLTSVLFSVSIFIIFHFHFHILNSPSMFRALPFVKCPLLFLQPNYHSKQRECLTFWRWNYFFFNFSTHCI